VIDVNIHGVLNGIAAVLPRFVAQGSGYVVNVASIAAHFVMPSAAVYCATKYAVWAITEGLRQEHDDIRTTIISVVTTELGNDITDPNIATALTTWRQKSLPPPTRLREQSATPWSSPRVWTSTESSSARPQPACRPPRPTPSGVYLPSAPTGGRVPTTA
jgi:short-subunit dehydrogenase